MSAGELERRPDTGKRKRACEEHDLEAPCRTCRSGKPGYSFQSQIENGDGRSSCQALRSQNVPTALSGFGSRNRIENATSVAAAKPAAKSPAEGRTHRPSANG